MNNETSLKHMNTCELVFVCAVLQADPGGPSFQTLFNNTEQMLKVGGGDFLATVVMMFILQSFECSLQQH